MKLEELQQDKELFESCMKEVEEKVRAGQDPEQAKLEVFRAHGAEFDEDAVKAKLVDKMELSAEELANVTGGGDAPCGSDGSDWAVNDWCLGNHACFYAAVHDSGKTPGQACAWNYECILIYKCSTNMG